MTPARLMRPAAALIMATAAAGLLAACTYVERERPPRETTVIVPQQPAPTVVTPANPPTVTVRPSY